MWSISGEEAPHVLEVTIDQQDKMDWKWPLPVSCLSTSSCSSKASVVVGDENEEIKRIGRMGRIQYKRRLKALDKLKGKVEGNWQISEERLPSYVCFHFLLLHNQAIIKLSRSILKMIKGNVFLLFCFIKLSID